MPTTAERKERLATRSMEGAMILSFWMALFFLLPLVGLATFACVMHRPLGRRR